MTKNCAECLRQFAGPVCQKYCSAKCAKIVHRRKNRINERRKYAERSRSGLCGRCGHPRRRKRATCRNCVASMQAFRDKKKLMGKPESRCAYCLGPRPKGQWRCDKCVAGTGFISDNGTRLYRCGMCGGFGHKGTSCPTGALVMP